MAAKKTGISVGLVAAPPLRLSNNVSSMFCGAGLAWLSAEVINDQLQGRLN